VRAIVITLVVALVAGGGYVFYNYQRFIGGVTHVDAIGESTGDDFDGTDQNILLVGDDHRPDGATEADLAKLGTEADGGGSNTDSTCLPTAAPRASSPFRATRGSTSRGTERTS
jgi:hypothetical protein